MCLALPYWYNKPYFFNDMNIIKPNAPTMGKTLASKAVIRKSNSQLTVQEQLLKSSLTISVQVLDCTKQPNKALEIQLNKTTMCTNIKPGKGSFTSNTCRGKGSSLVASH